MSEASLASRLVCAGCDWQAPDEQPYPFRCPAADSSPDVDHVVTALIDAVGAALATGGDANPFIRYRRLFHFYRLARRRGMSDGDYVDLVAELDRAIAEVDGHGFVVTPTRDFPDLAAALGVGAAIVKDETGNVSGSHKARHLMGIAIYLAIAERTGLVDRTAPAPRLAIASCGNAALAAAVVARAAGRQLAVFIPPAADPAVVARLTELGAELGYCARGEGDPPGDPCYHGFRAAVRAGDLPFTCQGSENGLTIEGGRTLPWELLGQCGEQGFDRIAIQVGGGALASSFAQGLALAREVDAISWRPVVHAVQTEGGYPLARAWRRLVDWIVAHLHGATATDAGDAGQAELVRERATPELIAAAFAHAASHRSEYMWPWEDEPTSAAGGILDDETYDWLVIVRAMIDSGGWPVVASEAAIAEANACGRAHTGIDVDATGTSGLAGLIALRDAGLLGAGERVAVLFTGVRRAGA